MATRARLRYGECGRRAQHEDRHVDDGADDGRIAAGWYYNSMALLADGFHMSSHAVAIGLSAFAYAAARPQPLWRWAAAGRFAVLLAPTVMTATAYSGVPIWTASDPIVMVVPPEVPNPTMDRGCWLRLSDGPNFSGQSFVLIGPAEIRALDLQTISRFRRRVSSAETGPKAVARFFAREDFGGTPLIVGPASRVSQVVHALPARKGHIEALRLSCID